MKRDRPLVLFTITNGWGIRNFVHTGLFEFVSRFADIGVAASKELYPFFQSLQDEGQIALTFELPSKETVFWRKVRQTKKAILQAKHVISTAQIKSKNNASGLTGKVARTVSWFVLQKLSAYWQIRVLELLESTFYSPYVLKFLKHPKVLINCSPFDFRDNQLQRSLNRQGTPSITIIPSWDNPSTKGCISSEASLVLVWGSNQKQELIAYYPNLNPDRIKISGIPQFDFYSKDLPIELCRHHFLKHLGISSECKVILYATCSEKLFPTEPEVVADVARAIDSGRFGDEAHLLIRCHPADRSERYQHLCSSTKVTIFPSSLNGTGSLATWIPPEDEIGILAATLRHCELCINTASTMTLDAFACGKPVINVAYDGDRKLQYLQSVRRYYDYHHYYPITQSGAVSIARSSVELLSHIEQSLTKPERLHSLRQAVLDNFCFRPKEGSVDFIIREIEKLAK